MKASETIQRHVDHAQVRTTNRRPPYTFAIYADELEDGEILETTHAYRAVNASFDAATFFNIAFLALCNSGTLPVVAQLDCIGQSLIRTKKHPKHLLLLRDDGSGLEMRSNGTIGDCGEREGLRRKLRLVCFARLFGFGCRPRYLCYYSLLRSYTFLIEFLCDTDDASATDKTMKWIENGIPVLYHHPPPRLHPDLQERRSR